jgi:hypothetical protein
LEFLTAREWPPKEFNNVCDTLRTYGRVASGAAKSHQETNMTCDAVTDGAEAREVDEKTLLENGGQRIVEVGSFCESPQFLGDLGCLRGEAEEIGKDSEIAPLRDSEGLTLGSPLISQPFDERAIIRPHWADCRNQMGDGRLPTGRCTPKLSTCSKHKR